MTRPVVREELEQPEFAQLSHWHERTGGQVRGSRKRLVGLGECSRVLSNKEVEGKGAVWPLRRGRV